MTIGKWLSSFKKSWKLISTGVLFDLIVVTALGCFPESASFSSFSIVVKSLGWSELKCEHMFEVFPLYLKRFQQRPQVTSFHFRLSLSMYWPSLPGNPKYFHILLLQPSSGVIFQRAQSHYGVWPVFTLKHLTLFIQF